MSYTRDHVLDHWFSCMPQERSYADRETELAAARETVAPWKDWELKDVLLEEIFSAFGTPLAEDGMVVQKLSAYEKLPTTPPPVVLKPMDRSQARHPFVWSKASDPKVRWEPADGVHRVIMALRKGAATVAAFVPKGGDNS